MLGVWNGSVHSTSQLGWLQCWGCGMGPPLLPDVSGDGTSVAGLETTLCLEVWCQATRGRGSHLFPGVWEALMAAELGAGLWALPGRGGGCEG